MTYEHPPEIPQQPAVVPGYEQYIETEHARTAAILESNRIALVNGLIEQRQQGARFIGSTLITAAASVATVVEHRGYDFSWMPGSVAAIGSVCMITFASMWHHARNDANEAATAILEA